MSSSGRTWYSEIEKRAEGIQMPIYDFTCEECGAETKDRLVLRADRDTPRCHVCGGEMRRNMSAPTFRLYGAGFTNRSHKDTEDFA